MVEDSRLPHGGWSEASASRAPLLWAHRPHRVQMRVQHLGVQDLRVLRRQRAVTGVASKLAGEPCRRSSLIGGREAGSVAQTVVVELVMALRVALVGWRADQGSSTSAVPAEDRVRQQAERVAVALHPCTTMNRPTSAVDTVEPSAGNVQAGAPRVDGSDLTIDVLRERRLFRRAHMEALLSRPGNCLSEYAIISSRSMRASSPATDVARRRCSPCPPSAASTSTWTATTPTAEIPARTSPPMMAGANGPAVASCRRPGRAAARPSTPSFERPVPSSPNR